MRKHLHFLTMLLLLSVNVSLSQTFSAGIVADYSTLNQREMKSLGFTGEIFVDKKSNWALNYNFRFGQTDFHGYKDKLNNIVNGSGFNFKITSGAYLAGVYLFKISKYAPTTADEDLKIMGLLCLIPEGVTYYVNTKKIFKQRGGGFSHFKYNYENKFGIYCNPLSVEGWSRSRQAYSETQLCLETGLKGDLKLNKKVSLKPYIGIKIQYNKYQFVGLNSGASINYNIK